MRCTEANLHVAANVCGVFRLQIAKERAGRGERGEKMLGHTKRLHDVHIKCTRRRVYHTHGGGVRVFLFLHARQTVHEILGDHEEIGYALKTSPRQIVVQLIYRIEGLELDTGFLKKLLKGKDLMHGLDRGCGAVVTVGIGGSNRRVTLHQNVIHTPGIDREAFDFRIFCKAGLDALKHAFQQSLGVPNEMPVLLLHAVREAVKLLRYELAVFVCITDDMAAGGRADIDRKIIFHILAPYIISKYLYV